MIKPLMKSEVFLRLPSVPATPADAGVGRDLIDTLAAHRESCVGMAANMIGVTKRVIVFVDGGPAPERAEKGGRSSAAKRPAKSADAAQEGTPRLMFNPCIVEQKGAYQTEEGCLSLVGVRPTQRYDRITVEYQDETFMTRRETFTGFTAQIIQHEIDHCNGVLI